MLTGMRFLRTCQMILLSGLLLGTGEAMSAQSTGNAPAQAPRAASPATVPEASSSKPETPPEPAITFEDVLRTVETTGRPATIRRDIAEDLGLIYNSDMPPVEAHALEDPKTSQEIYLIDGTHAI